MKTTSARSRLAAGSVLIVALALLVPCLVARDELQIDKAFIGAEGSWREVTALLQHQVKRGALSLTIAQPFEEIGGDPAWGQGKKLVIDYRFKGEPFRLLLEEQYPIAFEISLPSPEALRPGADARAAAIMAEAPTHPAPAPQPIPTPVTATAVRVAITLLLTFLCAVVAVVLAFLLRPRRVLWSLVPAVPTVVISFLGVTGWTPFGSFPEIGYTWSSGPIEVSVRSGWLFLIPLLVGTVAPVVATWRYCTRTDAGWRT
jgi:hypothetical protein